jgi:NAD(P)-dependent dehydrogenase (short-subunit alcohol dehydrogenase family)
MHVAMLDVDQEALAAAADEARSAGAAAVVPIICDVSDEAQVVGAFDLVESGLPLISGVVANAGVEVSESLFDASVDDWDRVMAVNLKGTFLTARSALRYWRRAERRVARLRLVAVSVRWLRRRIQYRLRGLQGRDLRVRARSRIGRGSRRYPRECCGAGCD